MLSYTKLQSKPRVFRSLTGITLSEFEELRLSFEQAWQDYIYTNYITREEQHLPERNPRKLEKVLAACVELEFIIDGTERPIHRPSESARRKEHYSGKKKRTTVKNNVITERRSRGKIKYLSQTVEGKKHDKKLADEEGYQFPSGSKLWKDTGFQGYEPKNVTTFQPKKKPQGGELTAAEKAHRD